MHVESNHHSTCPGQNTDMYAGLIRVSMEDNKLVTKHWM